MVNIEWSERKIFLIHNLEYMLKVNILFVIYSRGVKYGRLTDELTYNLWKR